MRLLSGESPSASYKAMVLTTAIELHLRVARIVATTFPEQLDPAKIDELFTQWEGLAVRVKLARTA